MVYSYSTLMEANSETMITLPTLIINSSLPGQNDRHFTDDNFKCIFVNEKFCISIKISLKFVPKGPINLFHNTFPLADCSPNSLK